MQLIATTFASLHVARVEKLGKVILYRRLWDIKAETFTMLAVLLGPVKSFAPGGVAALTGRAATVRQGGLAAIAAAVTAGGISALAFKSRPLVKSAVFSSLSTTPAEGYALACLALAAGRDPAYDAISAPTMIIGGDEDKTCPKATVEFLAGAIKGAKVVTLTPVGHWHQVEDIEGVSAAIKSFL